MSTDAEEYWERQDGYEARVAFERDGYGVPYTNAVRRAYEEFVRSERLHRDVSANLTRALAHELHKRDRSRATGGPLRGGSAGQIFVGDFPPLQNPGSTSSADFLSLDRLKISGSWRIA